MQFAPTALLDFATDIEDCKTCEAIVARLHETSKTLMPVLGIWRPPVPIYAKKWIRDGNTFVSSDAPPGLITEWHTLAAKHGISPIARRVQRDGTPFLWSELQREHQFIGLDLWVFDLVHRYGIVDLFSVPVAPWVVHYWTPLKRFKLAPDGRASLMVLAISAIVRCKVITQGKSVIDVLPDTLLSRREQEIAQLLANGKTEEEVADHLRVERSTVKTHVNRLRLKLGARNTTHALVIAARHHLISISGSCCWYWMTLLM